MKSGITKYNPVNPLAAAFGNNGFFLVVATVIIFSIVCMTVPVADLYNDEGVQSETMKKCEGSSCPQFGATLLVFFIALVLFMSFNRVLPVTGLVVIVVLSISALIYVNVKDHESFDDVFEIAKFYLIILASMALAGTRVWGILNDKHFGSDWSWVLYAILAVNIMAAVGSEIKKGFYINPVVGILLILMLPSPILGYKWTDILGVGGDGTKDLVYRVSMGWMILYTLWDMNYVYTDGREHFASVVVVLLTPLLTGMPLTTSIDPGLYVQARTYTLLFRYIILAFGDVFEKYTDSRGMYDDKIKTAWDGTNMAIAIVVFLVAMFTPPAIERLGWGKYDLRIT